MPGAQVSGVGLELGCLRLHFKRFEELGISHTFNLQSNFFQIEYFILQLFRMTKRGANNSRKKAERKL